MLCPAMGYRVKLDVKQTSLEKWVMGFECLKKKKDKLRYHMFSVLA